MDNGGHFVININELDSIYESLDRQQLNSLDLEDVAIYYKWRYKVSFARMRGIPMLLSLQEYRQLIKDAGIAAYQIGKSKNSYQLGRYGDTGNYEKGNCRFITFSQNQLERKISNKQRAANRKYGKIVGLLPKTESQKENGRNVCKLWASLPRSEKQIQTSKLNGRKMAHKRYHNGSFEDCEICKIQSGESNANIK
jgi:hypothetical protein